jgi:hypothetical protein
MCPLVVLSALTTQIQKSLFDTFSSLFQSQLFILFEHAAGYALFKVNEFEETGMLLPQVEASVTDLSRFNAVVKLIGFAPFKTAMSALENMNSISEGRFLISQYCMLHTE